MAQIETTHGGFYNVEETREEIDKKIRIRNGQRFSGITLTIIKRAPVNENVQQKQRKEKGTFIINNIVLITDN